MFVQLIISTGPRTTVYFLVLCETIERLDDTFACTPQVDVVVACLKHGERGLQSSMDSALQQ